jgi:glyoxylase-like metal-dependent hydrolase (beta-lactamase superfamily II)
MTSERNRKGKRIRLGSCECVVVDDGTFASREPMRELFGDAPRSQLLEVLERYRQADNGHPSMHRLCVVVYTGSHVALLDTGAGPSAGKLLDGFEAEQIGREDIDMVILSHRHPGHTGGLVLPDGDASFPNARIVETGDISEKTDLCDGITLLPAPGHAPEHVVALLGTGQERMLFLGDTFLHPIHFEYPEWSPTIDSDPGAAAETRRRLIELAIETEAVLLPGHFPSPGACVVAGVTKRYRWEPWGKSRSGGPGDPDI